MKKIKFIMPLIAVLLLIGAGLYAMHANRNQSKAFATQTWDYNGNPGGEDTASYYTLEVNGTPNHSSCGLSSSTICQIQAEPDANNPSQPELNGENPIEHLSDFKATLRGSN